MFGSLANQICLALAVLHIVVGQQRCQDDHQFCEFWASRGECQRNPAWMPANCRRSCGTCGSSEPPICVDKDRECGSFAQKGECEVNPVWMRPNCPLSCRVCQATPGGQQPAIQGNPDSSNIPSPPPVESPGPTVPRVSCQNDGVDRLPGCRQLASRGDCQTNPDFMLQNCQFSCGVCSNAGSSTNTFNQAPAAVNNIAKCDSLRQSVSDVQTSLQAENLVIPFEDTTSHQTISLGQIRTNNGQFGCVPPLGGAVDCQKNMCYNLKFRTMDGTCNNFQRPLMGSAFSAYKRLQPPVYDDDVAVPIASVRGGRPSPRDASRFLLSSPQVINNNQFNTLMMQWGQFLSHDIAKTTMLPNNNCRNCGVPPTSPCLSINVSPFDPNSRTFGCQGSNIGPICCVRTARSSPVCNTGTNAQNPRQQYNENTAFVDASMVYGSSVVDMPRFRNGATGFMRTEFVNGRPLMPFDRRQCNSSGCVINFEAGDDRANLFIGLGAMHVIFLREHNRIAARLQELNPLWNGDRVYQEARKIVGASIQAITYKEYLPRLFGPEFRRRIGAYQGYNSNIDPTIANVFASTAFRFGHGMVLERFPRLFENGSPIPQQGFNFLEGVFNSQKLVNEGGIDPVIRGMMATPVKRPHRITTSMTERLFGNIDLAAVNIERARDHGVPGYNTWRRFCNLKDAATFDDLRDEMVDPAVRANLQNSYGSPDSVDLYVAQLLEDPIPNAMIGRTLACLLGEQFRRLRDGDRFWFENPEVFTGPQLAEIEKVTLSRIICDNGDGFTRVPSEAFDLFDISAFSDCRLVQRMSLEPWKE